MTGEIIVAVLSFGGTIIGSVAGVIASTRLTNYRLEQLEKKVDKHNNLVERMALAEDHIASLKKGLQELRDDDKR